MLKIIHAFKTAFQDARKNLFHTLLSILGIVIGVGALVSILSLIDGMEAYANQQISSTTSLESIIIDTETTKRIDGVNVRKEEYSFFDYPGFLEFSAGLPSDCKTYLRYRDSGFIQTDDSTQRGIIIYGIVDTPHDKMVVTAGDFISKQDLEEKRPNILVSKSLAQTMTSEAIEQLVEQPFYFREDTFNIKGIIDTSSDMFEIFLPITIIADESLKFKPPRSIVLTPSVEKVLEVKGQILDGLEKQFGDGSEDFRVVTNEFRVKQANQAFLVFRIVMGLIVGISVIVGGIGVMNVLLISVTERTAEIGVRKAVGAKRKDIVIQFLSESLSVSFIGSFLGVLLGVSFTMIAVPIIKHFTEMPFEAAYTFNTLLVITSVAIIIGIVFGTYPAMKASKLDPVEAIRRE